VGVEWWVWSGGCGGRTACVGFAPAPGLNNDDPCASAQQDVQTQRNAPPSSCFCMASASALLRPPLMTTGAFSTCCDRAGGSGQRAVVSF